MRKFRGILFTLLGLLAWTDKTWPAPKLDIGAEYRARMISITNPTYGTENPALDSNGNIKSLPGSTIGMGYTSHRGRVYMTGKLDPGIEIGTVIEALGVQGSSVSLLNRYPEENFNPFLENLYVQVNEFHDLPLNITVGRLPYVWGTGLLISDDGLGFDGLRLDAGPFWGIHTHLFRAKARNSVVGSNDKDLTLAGLSYTWGIHDIKFGWIWENDQTGTLYSNLSSTTPAASDLISRTYYDLNVSGRFEKGAYYKFDYAIQSGRVRMPTFAPAPDTGLPIQTGNRDISLGGSALTFEGGFDFYHPRYKRMILAFVFMQGSGGDPSTKDSDSTFHPSFGHKYDGLEPSGYGDFFAATPYSFYNENKLIVPVSASGAIATTYPYDALFSGIRTFGFRGSVNPWEPFIAGLEFYIYSARTTPDIRQGSPTTILDGSLGRELVFSGSYNYAKRVNFSMRWGKFFPSDLTNPAGGSGSSRLTFEVSGKF